MKFALIDAERREAQPHLSGTCLCCGNPTIAKCGEERIWHWAHRGKCDPWKEGETEWHRAWKAHFPEAWQEVVHFAEDGEKHVADVKTNHSYVIECQHSSIKPEERRSREVFYKKMIWIVDGTRRVRDKDQFAAAWKGAALVSDAGKRPELRRIRFVEGALLKEWGGSNVPVFFDFGEDVLWWVLPTGLLSQIARDRVYVLNIPRNELIQVLCAVAQEDRFGALLHALLRFLVVREERNRVLAEQQERMRMQLNSRQMVGRHFRL